MTDDMERESALRRALERVHNRLPLSPKMSRIFYGLIRPLARLLYADGVRAKETP